MDDIKQLYEHTELTLQGIADHIGTSYKRVFNYVAAHYSKSYRTERKRISYRNSKTGELNPMTGKYAEQHHNYIGVVSDNKGYLMVLRPSWYTGRLKSKHIFLHHEVVCRHLEIPAVPKGWHVHHVDKDPYNNAFDNLVLITAGDHNRIHRHVLVGATTISKESTLKWVEAQGTPFRRDDIVCSAWEHAAVP